jgi:nitrogen-specific signal transduction histidine kinase
VTDEHHGTIEVESKPGNTVFRVRLPVADAG